VTSWDRKIKRNQMRALIVANARANGCTCDPDITLPKLEVGKVRVARVEHDNDCPHYRDPAGSGRLVDRINAGEFDQ
jgi:hypothetical protein